MWPGPDVIGQGEALANELGFPPIVLRIAKPYEMQRLIVATQELRLL
jgi:hypothetical protein